MISELDATRPNIKLNIGCYTLMFKSGWINMDILPIGAYAMLEGYYFVCHDVRTGIPLRDNLVGLIFASHFLEHIRYDEGERFLKECHRVMQPGATLRLAVPDMEKIVRMYLDKDAAPIERDCEVTRPYITIAQKAWHLLTDGHKAGYDFITLQNSAERAGFCRIKKCAYQQGHHVMMAECRDVYPEISLYVELVK